ncbi:MAG: hypothetical protein UW92_C0001G0009 [Candidatus Jorgensenbacteria bacterium GW2011_GWA2_45_13]|uniref:Uncharacterized protein n=1 Tax=Candidatus Jorgensenbacteria bacterium GW2011_GWA2_45_13 TaxID=1618662 RepID=A0A0G1L9M9_9BACT|nr:MAG: hypothetical protein UW92_C0001G0009 [Candidatus Jorgensenbacteria bacterium GW2011_GWA2_45_13]HIH19002.1 hypothetical protein [Candidatus Micrarchaeota archaeon]HIH30279.1 hypothetical protein [Candidatus Micrarchaeota archaeon]
MITSIRISKVEATRNKEDEISGLNVNISVDSVTVKGSDIAINFNYSVAYAEDVGELKMWGVVTSREDAKMSKEIADRWAKEKRLPDAFAELVLNAINYACGTNGVLVVRAINLSPPIMPPRIQIGNQPPGKSN